MAMLPQLTHVGLHTANIPAMERFYTQALGLAVTDRGKVPRLGNIDIVFMSANPGCHHQVVLLSWREGERPAATRPTVVNQLSFKVDTLDELRRVNGQLIAEGAKTSPIDHGNAWSVYAEDPDGNGVEIYLDTPWQVAQPHGVPLDLSKSDAAIHAETEARIKVEPTFQARERWMEQFARRIGAASG